MNERPLGPVISNWTSAVFPTDLSLEGTWASLAPLNADQDAAPLFDVFDGHPWVWDYLYEPPRETLSELAVMLGSLQANMGMPCHVIRQPDHAAALGYACFMNVATATGSIEIGNVNLSPRVQKTPIATDAFYLMIDWAFSNGFRRVEWKCNALNVPSRRAAQRLGFSFEGIFRKHLVVKGRNRDTSWFAMTDSDWSSLRPAFEKWLAPSNFDDGEQRQSLSSLTAPHLFQQDPSLS